MRNYYKPGAWNALCDVCGFKFKSDQLKKRWDGLMVCTQDLEPRHPQTLIRIPKDDPSVPWSRDEPATRFITSNWVDESTNRIVDESGNVLIWG